MKKCTRKTCTTPVEEQVFGNNKNEPDGLQTVCKDCKRESDKQYRESAKGKITKRKNSQSEKAHKYRKEYYKRPEVIKRQKEYKSTEEYKCKQRKYAQQEERKLARKLFQETEKYKIARAKYLKSQAYRESKKRSEGKRRANKKSGCDNTITQKYIDQLKKIQKYKCYHCGKLLDFADTKSVHLDHYVPLDKGGLHSVGNVVWSCAKCNISKRNKLPSKPLTFEI